MLLNRAARYGVYATVFLYKAKCAGAFQNDVQRRAVATLVFQFIAIMKEAPSVETHICHGYSRLLRQLWRGPEGHASSRTTDPQPNSDPSLDGQEDVGNAAESIGSPLVSLPAPLRADPDSPAWDWECFGDTNSYFASGFVGKLDDRGTFQTFEANPFGSLWPGISDLWGQEVVQNNSWEQQDPLAAGLHQAGVEQTGMQFLGTV